MGQTQELMALRQRVDGWRRNGGGRGSRIPEELWTSAVDVARDAGLYATARTLHFNYEGLKKRAQAASKRKRGRGAAFVAVQMLCQLRLSRGRFRHWPSRDGSTKRELLAHELQVLLAGGDPAAAHAPPPWRPIRPGAHDRAPGPRHVSVASVSL